MRNSIARLEKDGRLDQTLNPNVVGDFGVSRHRRSTGRQDSHRWLFSSVSGVSRHNIARLNSDGTLDTVFNPNANNVVYSIAVQADGKILAGGDFTNIGGQTRNRMARLDAVPVWQIHSTRMRMAGVGSLAVQADGKILGGRGFQASIGGQTRNCIARLDATTGLADSFDSEREQSSSIQSRSKRTARS